MLGDSYCNISFNLSPVTQVLSCTEVRRLNLREDKKTGQDHTATYSVDNVTWEVHSLCFWHIMPNIPVSFPKGHFPIRDLCILFLVNSDMAKELAPPSERELIKLHFAKISFSFAMRIPMF